MPVQVEIAIDDSVANTFKIQVTPDPINLAGQGATGNVSIQWDITNPNWSFFSNGIDVQRPGKAFSPQAAGGGPKRCIWNRNAYADRNPYKYSVSVKNTAGTTLIIDPTIINEP